MPLPLPLPTHVTQVCRIGAGPETCRYLSLFGNEWQCLKLTPLRVTIDCRAAEGRMKSLGDNCEGRDSAALNAP